jgi:hypothetical protein
MASRFFSFLALSLSKGLFFVFSLASTAQETVNLVPNPSFEEFENVCPINLNEMPIGWSKWRSSPNSFSTCVEPQNLVDSLGWAPLNGFGIQFPFDGDSYVGLYAFGPSPKPGIDPAFREYLGTELLEPLTIGTTYYVSFKASLALEGFYYPMSLASSNLGAIFTLGDYDEQLAPMPIPNFAHIYSQEIITDQNWITISGSVVADQSYTHVGLGVFFEFEFLTYLEILPGLSLGSYYYLDDVCVSIYPDCDVSTHVVIGQDIGVKLLPNPAQSMFVIEASDVIELIKLFDLRGNVLRVVRGSGSNRTEIECSTLQDGVYILETKTTKGIKREKLVIVR